MSDLYMLNDFSSSDKQLKDGTESVYKLNKEHAAVRKLEFQTRVSVLQLFLKKSFSD